MMRVGEDGVAGRRGVGRSSRPPVLLWDLLPASHPL